MNNNDKKLLGKYGEDFTTYLLEKSGYTILKRNFTIRGGEIDIIAKKGEIIAFVEVKTRSENHLVDGVSAVTLKKRNLIIKSAEAYNLKFPHNLQPRFDVCEVTMSNNYQKIVSYNYISNAFDNSN